jgi:hypothetical protein
MCLTGVVFLGLAETAAAQRSRFDVAGGYQFTRAGEQSLPVGWSADVAVTLDSPWSIVGEISGAYRRQQDDDLGVDVRLSVHSLGAGARWSRRAGTAVVPFFQVLAGAARLRARAEILNAVAGDSSTRFMLQPGAGVQLNMNERFGFVGQADYRRVFPDDDERQASGADQLRVFVGVRVGL